MTKAAVSLALALAFVVSACRSNAARTDGGPGKVDLDASVSNGDARATGDAGTTGDGGTTGDAVATGDAPAAPRRICDGSDAIRLAFGYPVSPSRVVAFTAEMYELGAEFLYVDGHCHYWMQEPQPTDQFGSWRAFREGQLTAAQEAALHDAVSYDDFAAGGPACTGPLAIDQTPARFWDGREVHVCAGILQAPAGWPMRIELAQTTTAMNGPMRVMVGRQSVPPDAPIYPWPLAGPPASYEIDYSASMAFGVSTLITDPTELAALRSVRDRAIADGIVAPGNFYDAIFVDASGTVISMRDDVPFANQSGGLWGPP